MSELLINQLAVGAFLLLTLLIGFWTRGAKDLREYATAGRSLSSGVLLVTLLATVISAREIAVIGGGFF